MLIVPLFVISAAGVYNSMMIFLEGEQYLRRAWLELLKKP